MATIAYDLKLTSNDDLYIDPIAMDFVIAPSDQQHIKDIFQSKPGDWKEFFKNGWNPYMRLKSRISRQKHIQDATIQLQADGYIVRAIDFDLDPDGELTMKVLDVIRP